MIAIPDLKPIFHPFHSGRWNPDTVRRPDDVTIVTGFFDIGRGAWEARGVRIRGRYHRSVEQYLRYFANLAGIRNDMVIFIDERLAGEALRLRHEAGTADQTAIFAHANLFNDPVISGLRELIRSKMSDGLRRFVLRPDKPEYNSPEYVLVNALKAGLVCAASELNAVHARQTAWVDFGYCRDDQRFDRALPWRFDARGKINLFHVWALDELPVIEVVRRGWAYFQGCHIVGPVEQWPWFRREMDASLTSLLECDLIDDDQTLMLMAWRRAPAAYITHAVDPSDWYVLFRRFTSSSVPLPPIAPTPHPSGRTPLWLVRARHAVRRMMG